MITLCSPFASFCTSSLTESSSDETRSQSFDCAESYPRRDAAPEDSFEEGSAFYHKAAKPQPRPHRGGAENAEVGDFSRQRKILRDPCASAVRFFSRKPRR